MLQNIQFYNEITFSILELSRYKYAGNHYVFHRLIYPFLTVHSP